MLLTTGPLFNHRAEIVAGKEGDGIPGFWLHALQNNEEFTNLVCCVCCCWQSSLAHLVLHQHCLDSSRWCSSSFCFAHQTNVTACLSQITDKDAPILHYLTDISSQDSEKGGFKLVFRFAKNEYFDHESLVRAQQYDDDCTLCTTLLTPVSHAGKGVRDGWRR